MTDDAIPNRAAMHARFRADPYAAQLGATLDDWGAGWARVGWTPRDDQCNFAGGLHGGAIFSAADVALSVASNSWGRQAVALSVEAQFLASAPVGAPLTATCRERSRSRRTGAYLIEVTDADDALVASLHAVTYRASRWHLGAEAWPDDWRATH